MAAKDWLLSYGCLQRGDYRGGRADMDCFAEGFPGCPV